MLDSTLAHAIANDPLLRLRLEALMRKRLVAHTVTNTERALLETARPVLVEHVAWQVAGNPSIFGAVKAQVEANPDAPAAAAIETAATDGDLTYVLHSQLTCLAD